MYVCLLTVISQLQNHTFKYCRIGIYRATRISRKANFSFFVCTLFRE